jgi:S1-C subfamily serine protease
VVRVAAERPLADQLPEAIRARIEELRAQGFFPDGAAVGTGFLVSAEGTVLTDARIVSGASRVRVRFSDGQDREAVVIGSDPFFQVGVLKVKPPEGVAPLALAGSDPPPVGALGVFVGNSWGISANLSLGLVTGNRRTPGPDPMAYDNYVVMNATVLPGDNGGPLLAPDGTVLGMGVDSYSAGTVKFVAPLPGGGGEFGIRPLSSPGGMGLVVPAADLRYALSEIERYGRVRSARIGIRVLPGEVRVRQVLDGTPAAAAGLAAGDLLTSFDGQAVATDVDFRYLLRRTPVGRSVAVLVRRGEGEIPLTVDLAEALPDAVGLVPYLADGSDGRVLVGEVGERYRAAGLLPGDAIVAVNGLRVNTTKDVAQALGAFGESGLVTLSVLREGAELEVRLTW